MPEVELDTALEAPFKRNLVDRPGALALVHRRVIVPGRVEMRAVVSRKLHALNGPALALGQVFLLEPWKEGKNLRQTLAVVRVFDFRAESRRVCGDVILKGHGNIDQATDDRCFLQELFARFTPVLGARPCWSEPRSDRREVRSYRRCRESARSPVRNNCRPCRTRKTRRRGSSRPATRRR